MRITLLLKLDFEKSLNVGEHMLIEAGGPCQHWSHVGSTPVFVQFIYSLCTIVLNKTKYKFGLTLTMTFTKIKI